MRRAALAILVACSGPALAQEEVFDALDVAIADGFESLVGWHRGDESFFGTELDRLVVAPFMRAHATGSGYRFTFRQMDIDGDGDGDAIINLRTDAALTSGDGGPVLVSYFEGGRWDRPELHEAMRIVVRDPVDRPGFEVALVNDVGYVVLEP